MALERLPLVPYLPRGRHRTSLETGAPLKGRSGGVRERGDSSKLFTEHDIRTGGNLEVKYSHVGIFQNETLRLR